MWTITARRIAAVKLDSLIADTDACVIKASQENSAKQVIILRLKLGSCNSFFVSIVGLRRMVKPTLINLLTSRKLAKRYRHIDAWMSKKLSAALKNSQ